MELYKSPGIMRNLALLKKSYIKVNLVNSAGAESTQGALIDQKQARSTDLFICMHGSPFPSAALLSDEAS